MGAVSTALVIHNAMMLSNNLASTISEALNVSLEALNLRDETDTPIDIGGFVSSRVQSILTNILGAEAYAEVTARIAKANRIYQAGSNVLNAATDLFDSARSVAETTAENTGKIGNALLEAGVVYEDAYEEMVDKINPQSLALRRLESFRGRLDEIDDTVSTVSNIASEIVSIKDSYKELHDAKDEWEHYQPRLWDYNLTDALYERKRVLSRVE